MKQRTLVLAAGIALTIGQAVRAADEKPSTQEQIDALQKQIDELKKAQQTDQLSTAEQPKVSINYNRATITSADGRSSIAFRALMQADAGYYDQDPDGPLTTDFRRGSVGTTPNRDNSAARDLSSGVYFRRARFGFEGLINRDFNYRLLVEVGGAGTETQGRINDAWISYSGFAPFTFQIGAFSPATNMDDGTSADDTLFLERGSATEMSRSLGGADGRIGAGVRASGARWMSALTFTSRTVADAEVTDSQTAILGRAGFLVATSANYNVHVGASGTYVINPADQGVDSTGARYTVRLRDRPELRVDSARLIDTGNVDADHAYVAGLEFGANWRNFYLQAENFYFGIERSTDARDPHFGGYYVQTAWTITGEPHRYNAANGAYAAPRPMLPFNSSGGTGAWELALRFSHTDLDFEEGIEGSVPPSGSSIRGGTQDIWTLGVNWYATPSVKFMLNFLRVDVDRINPATSPAATPFGPAPATPPVGVQIGQQYNAIALRSQFNF
ncbi:MAG TPA: porin [Steroidobacteraceae bacterium]|nr:porin [Steroidobacteraceae bacterium]